MNKVLDKFPKDAEHAHIYILDMKNKTFTHLKDLNLTLVTCTSVAGTYKYWDDQKERNRTISLGVPNEVKHSATTKRFVLWTDGDVSRIAIDKLFRYAHDYYQNKRNKIREELMANQEKLAAVNGLCACAFHQEVLHRS